MTEPEQWAVELWRKACHDYGGASIEDTPAEWRAVMAIQRAFEERERKLRESAIAQPSGDEVEAVKVPRGVIAFLKGRAPLKGAWFGERHPTEPGAYWWRKYLPNPEASEEKP